MWVVLEIEMKKQNKKTTKQKKKPSLGSDSTLGGVDLLDYFHFTAEEQSEPLNKAAYRNALHFPMLIY